MNHKERVNVQELYDWVVSTIENHKERFGSLIFQSEWIPLPDYFFKYKNDKIFSSGVQISYDDEFFCFGMVTDQYLEPFGFCRMENLMNNDEVFQKELGYMLEAILNRQEDRRERYNNVMVIKNSILEAIKENTLSCPYDITDYLSYSEKQEQLLLKNIFKFEPFEVNKKNEKKIVKDINKNTAQNFNKNADEIYEQKYNELRSLFYSPDTEKYPLPEVINPGNLKIKADLLKKGDPLVIKGVEYIVEENVIFTNHTADFIESSGGDEIDIKVTHRASVSLYRESDNNLYSMDVYIKEEKDEKGNNMYYFDEIIEEQLYIHNVTINLPEDDRPVAISSYFIDSKVKEIYKDYNHEKAYKREDFNNYLAENGNRNNIDHEVLKLFINEFENNKNLLSEDFDVRKWSDNVININYGLNLSSEQQKLTVRKRKM